MDAVRLIRRELAGQVPLIGFAGSPWTVATYMVEGGSSATFADDQGDAVRRAAHCCIDCSRSSRARRRSYLNAQIAAGAQAVMVFDTWGGDAGAGRLPRVFARSTWSGSSTGSRASRRPARAGHPVHQGRRHVAARDGGDSGCDALGVDWTTDLSDARRVRGPGRAAGQPRPVGALRIARGDPRRGRPGARKLWPWRRPRVQPRSRHPSGRVDPEHAAAMVAAVHELSPPYHSGAGERTIRARRAQLVAQLAPQDLADVGLRQLVAELDDARHLVAGEFALAVARSALLGR